MPDVDIGVDIGGLSCYKSSPHVPRYPGSSCTPEPWTASSPKNCEVARTFLPPSKPTFQLQRHWSRQLNIEDSLLNVTNYSTRLKLLTPS